MRSIVVASAILALALPAAAKKTRTTVDSETETTTKSSGGSFDGLKSKLGGLFGGGGLGGLHFGGSSTSSSTKTKTVKTEESHQTRINGVDVDDDGEQQPKRRANRGGGFGDTCTDMDDCSTRMCVVPHNDGRSVGFCSKFCSSWTDCPSHWECQRLSNTAQKVCVQPRD